MTFESKLWACDSEGLDQGGCMIVKREQNPPRDRYFAEFRNKTTGDKFVVRISPEQLKEFGQAANGDKAGQLERVLRANLETYAAKVGNPPPELSAKDLGRHLYPLQRQFKQEAE